MTGFRLLASAIRLVFFAVLALIVGVIVGWVIAWRRSRKLQDAFYAGFGKAYLEGRRDAQADRRRS